MQRRRLPAALAAIMVGAAVLTAGGVHAATTEGHLAITPPSRADDPSLVASNGEPSEPATIVDRNGTRYVAYQGGSQLSTTNDGGRTWRHFPASILSDSAHLSGCTSGADVGDVELTTDQAGRTYFADLQAFVGAEADTGVQPVVGRSDNGFSDYEATCAAHQPFSVDREWMAAWTPPRATGADQSRVYLTYHDFGPDAMWVNHSTDGGKTWSLPVNILGAEGAPSSACDTVPGGIAVDPADGTVYAAWVAGDTPATNAATGCNYTQATVFNKLYVAVSHDGGETWKANLAFQGPGYTGTEPPSDMSEIFTSIGVDRGGNVYVTFPAFLASGGSGPEFGAYLVKSTPANPDTGELKFTAPKKYSSPDVHTAYFTRLVAGDDGRLDLMYLGTPVKNVIVTPETKTAYTGADPTQPNCSPETTDIDRTNPTGSGHGVRMYGKPCQLPATAPWYLYLAQTLDGGKTFTQQRVRPEAVHTGDICTLGIFCLPADNRDIADVNDIKIDNTGGVQLAYTYEPKGADGKYHTEIDFQCQAGGPGLYKDVKVRSCQQPAPKSHRDEAAPAAARSTQ